MLGWFYLILLAVQIFLLVRSCRARKGVGKVLILNICAIALSCFLLWYFDTLPGFGMMPGFAYFPEVLYSLIAAFVYAILTLVTFLCWLYRRKK